MSAMTRINITDLPESLRTAVREGQTVVIKKSGKKIGSDMAQVRTVSKHPKIPGKRPIGVLGKSSKKLRPIGVLVGKMSVPTEEDFSKYDLEIQTMFGEEDK
ncbi:hypothetical protein [Photorhabdus cinerea]|uniref:Uncharacterized protein n=1 Tax=Photorhabdus cinerea TaxID=471575 RepID=A0A7X5THB2_9GAMM|nr:hypothetical protein [Photorhabdus cinerea]NHB93646.1 hypothetical protein [Photorhabdus cinerea]